jgi:hypothetical protein
MEKKETIDTIRKLVESGTPVLLWGSESTHILEKINTYDEKFIVSTEEDLNAVLLSSSSGLIVFVLRSSPSEDLRTLSFAAISLPESFRSVLVTSDIEQVPLPVRTRCFIVRAD